MSKNLCLLVKCITVAIVIIAQVNDELEREGLNNATS